MVDRKERIGVVLICCARFPDFHSISSMFQIVAQEISPELLKALFSIEEVVRALRDAPEAENLAIAMVQLPTPAPHILGRSNERETERERVCACLWLRSDCVCARVADQKDLAGDLIRCIDVMLDSFFGGM